MSWFKPNKFNQPRPLDPPPAPTDENPRVNQFLINEKERSVTIVLYHNGDTSICTGLGSLEMAKDMVKQKMSEWSRRERPSLLVPSNGKRP